MAVRSAPARGGGAQRATEALRAYSAWIAAWRQSGFVECDEASAQEASLRQAFAELPGGSALKSRLGRALVGHLNIQDRRSGSIEVIETLLDAPLSTKERIYWLIEAADLAFTMSQNGGESQYLEYAITQSRAAGGFIEGLMAAEHSAIRVGEMQGLIAGRYLMALRYGYNLSDRGLNAPRQFASFADELELSYPQDWSQLNGLPGLDRASFQKYRFDCAYAEESEAMKLVGVSEYLLGSDARGIMEDAINGIAALGITDDTVAMRAERLVDLKYPLDARRYVEEMGPWIPKSTQGRNERRISVRLALNYARCGEFEIALNSLSTWLQEVPVPTHGGVSGSKEQLIRLAALGLGACALVVGTEQDATLASAVYLSLPSQERKLPSDVEIAFQEFLEDLIATDPMFPF